MNGESTAVAPSFYVHPRSIEIHYVCRSCPDRFTFARTTTRDQRMLVLAHHLADAHGLGPLAAPTEGTQ